MKRHPIFRSVFKRETNASNHWMINGVIAWKNSFFSPGETEEGHEKRVRIVCVGGSLQPRTSRMQATSVITGADVSK
jgi:hypothetical protein